MNSNTTLAIFAVLAAMALVGATVTYVIIPADAQGANSGFWTMQERTLQ